MFLHLTATKDKPTSVIAAFWNLPGSILHTLVDILLFMLSGVLWLKFKFKIKYFWHFDFQNYIFRSLDPFT